MTRVIFVVTDTNKPILESWAKGDPDNDIPAKAFDCVAGAAHQTIGAPDVITHWKASAVVTPEQMAVITEAEGLGYLTIGEDPTIEPLGFVVPPPAIPARISAAQAHMALYSTPNPAFGVSGQPTELLANMLDVVETVMSDPATSSLFRIFWEKTEVFERASPAINSIAAVVGLTQEQVDALFILADSINP